MSNTTVNLAEVIITPECLLQDKLSAIYARVAEQFMVMSINSN